MISSWKKVVISVRFVFFRTMVQSSINLCFLAYKGELTLFICSEKWSVFYVNCFAGEWRKAVDLLKNKAKLQSWVFRFVFFFLYFSVCQANWSKKELLTCRLVILLSHVLIWTASVKYQHGKRPPTATKGDDISQTWNFPHYLNNSCFSWEFPSDTDGLLRDVTR